MIRYHLQCALLGRDLLPSLRSSSVKMVEDTPRTLLILEFLTCQKKRSEVMSAMLTSFINNLGDLLDEWRLAQSKVQLHLSSAVGYGILMHSMAGTKKCLEAYVALFFTNNFGSPRIY